MTELKKLLSLAVILSFFCHCKKKEKDPSVSQHADNLRSQS